MPNTPCCKFFSNNRQSIHLFIPFPYLGKGNQKKSWLMVGSTCILQAVEKSAMTGGHKLLQGLAKLANVVFFHLVFKLKLNPWFFKSIKYLQIFWCPTWSDQEGILAFYFFCVFYYKLLIFTSANWIWYKLRINNIRILSLLCYWQISNYIRSILLNRKFEFFN